MGGGKLSLVFYSPHQMDISTKRDTHVHLHCETLQSVCVTDRMVSFTTASGDSLLVHLSREQIQELIREIRRELADSWES
jgi:DNA-binding IclR family transcriptional regulator